MTYLINDADRFAAQSLAGFVSAHPDFVRAVEGGVVRALPAEEGSVRVITGGGSGHFPAFAGWTGEGFADGAACGNVFASPSERQILSVARAAGTAAGILFAPINYAGDILHFGAAAQTLREEGVDVRMMPITDDIASAPSTDHGQRRGIAGSFIVLKVVGAAAARGWSLDDVERVAIASNQATRTLGVAFSGCTLPGAPGPLFTVPPGRMAVGLGIHGEPGIDEVDLSTADDAVDTVLDRLLLERPVEEGRPVALVVNGLGGTSPDELHLVFRRALDRLTREGMAAVAPVIGAQMTSYDMAGFSLSLCYLDDELSDLWTDAASSASFRRGAVSRAVRHELDVVDAAEPSSTDEAPSPAPGSAGSQAAAATVLVGLRAAAELIDAHKDELGALDAVAGDGDHGIGMARGVRAAVAAADTARALRAGAGSTLRAAGTAWSDVGGGTSGALWGAGLNAAASALGDSAAPGAEDVLRAVQAFTDAVVKRGGANVGDKTMVDALLPFTRSLGEGVADNRNLADAWSRAAHVADTSAQSTADLVARLGRSRTHGDRSIGTPDPGATSLALIIRALINLPSV